MRSATGGSLPAFTSAASCGASLNVFGNFAASVRTSGPSSFPIRLLPAFCAIAAAATAQVSAPTARAIVSLERKVRVCMGSPFPRAQLESSPGVIEEPAEAARLS